MKTYTTARPHSIESHDFKAGDVLGTGDISKGEFKPAEGLARVVELGHLIPRVADGRVSESSSQPGPSAATSDGPARGRKSKKTTPTKRK